jgi:hypothetical protein
MRRGFDRPLGRRFTRAVPPLLRRANQLMAARDYAGAASAFEQLARAAEARGGPRAPFFFVQCGRARLAAGQKAEAVESVERGLGLFAVRGQTVKLANVGDRLIADLGQQGLTEEARKITDYVKGLLPNYVPGSSGSGAAGHPALPTHCPGCAAPIRPDEVEWLDDATAQCAYCGTPVRAT